MPDEAPVTATPTATPTPAPVAPPGGTTTPGNATPSAGAAPKPGTSTPAPDGAAPGATPKTGKEIISMPAEAFAARIARASEAALMDAFGTKDKREILKIKQDYEKLKAEAEDSRRSKLASDERMREDLEKSKRELAEVRTKYETAEREKTATQQDQTMRELAGGHINMKYWKHVARDFAEDMMAKYNERQIAKLTPEQIKGWFAAYAKTNPAFAKPKARPAAPAAPAAPPRRVPVTTGQRPGATPKAPASGGVAKTAKLGQPNSMTDAEWKEYKRANNIHY